MAKYVLCCVGRGEHEKPAFYFFDRSWKLQRLNRSSLHLPDDFSVPKPEGIDQLFDYAEMLSKPFPFVRADFYLENGKAYFGELTFTPSAGYTRFTSLSYDIALGNMVQLPDTVEYGTYVVKEDPQSIPEGYLVMDDMSFTVDKMADDVLRPITLTAKETG